MKKKIVKLDQKQLRSLIKESLQGEDPIDVFVEAMRQDWADNHSGQPGHKEQRLKEANSAAKRFKARLVNLIADTEAELADGDHATGHYDGYGS